MSFLIDTDIIIYSIKGNGIVQRNFALYADVPKMISVVTYGELLYGAHRSQHPIKNMATVRRIAELFPVIDISSAIIETFAAIKAQKNKKGSPIDDMDLLIAATALHLNCTLITNNQRHFTEIPGLEVKNWTKEN